MTTVETEVGDPCFLLTADAVRTSLDVLSAQWIHEDFLAYMLARRLGLAFDPTLSGQPEWRAGVASLASLEGGGSKPYYRPFTSRGTNGWLNANPAGSWSKASMGHRVPSQSIFEFPSKNHVSLKAGHAAAVLEHHLRGEPVGALALAVFFLKSRGFRSSGTAPTADDLIAHFRDEFGFPDDPLGNADFDLLCRDDSHEFLDAVGDGGLFERLDGVPEWAAEVPAGEGVRRTEVPVKRWRADEVGVESEVARTLQQFDTSDDEVALSVMSAVEMYGGAILSGPPGTGKTWYARKIALLLTDGNNDQVRFVQFHPSFQYEDFMEGYVGTDEGFKMKPRHFLDLCLEAGKVENSAKTYVLIVDELSRADPGRVFGEALTYIEKDKRGEDFDLASGRRISVPENLVILATMNPLDRGVDEVDQAFSRRFALIPMEPDRRALDGILAENNVEPWVQATVRELFEAINSRGASNPMLSVGHAYFAKVQDAASLDLVWTYQIRHLVDRACLHDPESRQAIYSVWESRSRAAPEPELAVAGGDADAADFVPPSTDDD
jgi:5-methylcytosine-specific restriction protein B